MILNTASNFIVSVHGVGEGVGVRNNHVPQPVYRIFANSSWLEIKFIQFENGNKKFVFSPREKYPYFLTFRLNTERYGVSLHIQSECGKIRTRKTPNTGTFNAVLKSCFPNEIFNTFRTNIP